MGSKVTLSMELESHASRCCIIRPCLYLVAATRPQAVVPVCVSLENTDRVTFSRSDQCHVTVASEGAIRDVRIGIADNWISSTHAKVFREAGRWKLVDLQSKNGTKINGLCQNASRLRDGDLIEIGRTFFVFRSRVMIPHHGATHHNAPKPEELPELVTTIPSLAARFDELTRLAGGDTSILIQGPSGSGKELLARAVHELSGRSGRFVAVNCAGMSEMHAESELFGYECGAFPGATSNREGLIAASAGGTLFLDEIDKLPMSIQGKLLRVLQEHAVRPFGSNAEINLDLRIVSATQQEAARMR